MPEKQDYDDELVRLLGRGELSDRQIADRLGISRAQVSRIALGEKRPDLQPRILAAMRQTLKQAWKNGGRLETESGDPLPSRRGRKSFDRHLAVELIGAGELTTPQIAERLGLHRDTVWRIATGRTHPELQPLIREAQQYHRDRARRIGTKWAAQIVTKQIKVGLKNNGCVGLRARQDLLDRFLGPEDDQQARARDAACPPPNYRPFSADLEKLPEPLQTQVIEALGGPVDEDEESRCTSGRAPPGR